MNRQTVLMNVGGVDVLVQTIAVAGVEKTSTADKAADRVADAFEKAKDVIVGAALSSVDVLGKLGRRAVRPDKLEVEFGLGFSAKGNVIVVGGQADATLKVKLVFDAAAQALEQPEPQGAK